MIWSRRLTLPEPLHEQALAEAQRQLAERDARIQSLLTAQESKAREEAAVLSRLRSLEEEREERERSLTGVVSRFEGALSSLAALEQRYEALAGSEARGAERAQAAETSLENARKESAAFRDRVERLESEARRSEDARSLAEAEADRCRASGASAQALLEAARTSLESCRRDAQQWAAERARLSAAVERADSRADALGREVEALRLAARAAEESAFGAQRQLDQERLLHAQLLEGKEAEARAQLDRSALDHEVCGFIDIDAAMYETWTAVVWALLMGRLQRMRTFWKVYPFWGNPYCLCF